MGEDRSDSIAYDDCGECAQDVGSGICANCEGDGGHCDECRGTGKCSFCEGTGRRPHDFSGYEAGVLKAPNQEAVDG